MSEDAMQVVRRSTLRVLYDVIEMGSGDYTICMQLEKEQEVVLWTIYP